MNNFQRLLENNLNSEDLVESVPDALIMAGLLLSAGIGWVYAKSIAEGGWTKMFNKLKNHDKSRKIDKMVSRFRDMPEVKYIKKSPNLSGSEKHAKITAIVQKNVKSREIKHIKELIDRTNIMSQSDVTIRY